MEIHRAIFILEEKVMGRRDEMEIKGEQGIDDDIMRKNGIRDHALKEDGMGLTAVLTDDSGDQNLMVAIKDIDVARIRSMKIPIMMGTGRTDDGIKSNRIDDIIISCLIQLDFFV